MAISALSKVGIAVESSWGAGGSPEIVMPVDDWSITPQFEQILDNARRGVLAKDFAAYQGIERAEASMDGPVFPYYFGYVLKSIFGSIATSGSAPYVHTFDFYGTPPSLALLDDTVIRTHEGKGFLASDLSISFNPTEGQLGYSTSWVGKTIGTANYSFPDFECPVEPFFRGWQGSIALGGTYFPVIEGDFTITRDVNLHYQLQNTQSPGTAYVDAPEVTGSFTIDYESGSDYDRYQDHESGSVNMLWVIDSNNQLEFQFGSVNFGEGPVELDKSGASITLGYSWRGLYACDLGGPARAVLTSTKASY